jgi:hypothetical protein
MVSDIRAKRPMVAAGQQLALAQGRRTYQLQAAGGGALRLNPAAVSDCSKRSFPAHRARLLEGYRTKQRANDAERACGCSIFRLDSPRSFRNLQAC